MAELNDTIVPAHDPQASAQFLADILGLTVDPPLAHFTPVTLANGVSLDFDHYEHVDEHHYACQLSDEEFDTAFARIRHSAITYYADPAADSPGTGCLRIACSARRLLHASDRFHDPWSRPRATLSAVD